MASQLVIIYTKKTILLALAQVHPRLLRRHTMTPLRYNISFDDESTKALPDSVPSPVAASSKEFVKLTSQMLLENSSATKSDISPSRRKIYKSERLGYINVKRRFPVVISGRNPQLDWEVIELSDSSPWLTNSILPAGRSEPSMLTSIMKSTDFQDGEVTIIAGSSGLTKGWLRSCPAYMQFEGASFEAFQILLDKPLGKSTFKNPAQLFH